jgi:transcriptional regulator with XRE-family HTH domain
MPRLTPQSENRGNGKKFVLSESEQHLLKQVGAQIVRDLNRTGMTVEELATKAGIARSTLREIIAGRSNPRLLTVHSAAIALGYPGIVSFCQTAISTNN